uniref:DEP domain-containing protein n=1 Tax=Globisporangium ultimum (strain ATCC 200006 / CBS 805.95 / DAOM BR144) TaxID=431595 RepID=K3W5U8_GLOUD
MAPGEFPLTVSDGHIKSISFPALRRAVGITLLLSTYLIPVVWVSRKLKTDNTLTPGMQDVVSYIGLVLRLALLPIYAYVIASPPARASKRTLREYCVYVGIYHGLHLVGNYLAEDRIRNKADPDAITTVSRRGSSYASESSLNTRVAPQQQRMQTTGWHAVAMMLREQIVQSRSEAVRLDNLLMDAGVLHHVKHERPFENDKAAPQVYYFDHNCIQMHEPPMISILEEELTLEQQEALALSTGMKRITHGLLHQDAALRLCHAPVPMSMPRAESATAAAEDTDKTDKTWEASRCTSSRTEGVCVYGMLKKLKFVS